MRIYQIIAEETGNNKRRQKTIGVISAADEKIPAQIYNQLSPDDRLELLDRMRMLREQAEYEDTRRELKRLPEMLKRAAMLLANNRLTFTDEQQTALQNEMNAFLKQLRTRKNLSEKNISREAATNV